MSLETAHGEDAFPEMQMVFVDPLQEFSGRMTSHRDPLDPLIPPN